MANTENLVRDNIRCLEQSLSLLESLRDDAFTRVEPRLHARGIGPHLRHNVDHYRSLLDGLPTGRVDYDARERDPRLETDRVYAIAQTEDLIRQLDRLVALDADTPVAVKMDCGEEIEQWVQSTLGRELEFLLSHAVHHYALVAFIVRLQGLDPPADFGVAPSTLRYQQSCAPPRG
jgi:hypothetical protein